jgi:hypothetical protein
MLYEIIPNTLKSNYNPKKKLIPNANGIIVSSNAKTTDLVTNQLKYLSLRQHVLGKAWASSSTTTQSVDVHSLQSLSNPYGNQQPEGTKNRG